MTPLLIAGILIFLVGAAILVTIAFRENLTWGWLCVLCPPAQWLFAALDWPRRWEALLMQGLGLALVCGYFLQAGGFNEMVMRQTWDELVRTVGQPMKPTSGSAVITGNQGVSSVTLPEEPNAVNDGSVQQVQGNVGPAAVVVAKPEKQVDTAPIYKCVDAQGQERFSREPCDRKR